MGLSVSWVQAVIASSAEFVCGLCELQAQHACTDLGAACAGVGGSGRCDSL